MSEPLDGVPPATPPTPRESAVVVAVRPGPAGLDVLMHLRSRHAAFLPSHWAFPGGRLEPIDEPARAGAHARCAAREFAEETGLKLDATQLLPLGVRTTPPFHPLRFRTEFFLVQLPPETTVERLPHALGEMEEQAFLAPRAAYDGWYRGELALPPVLPPLLRVLAEAVDHRPHFLAHELRQVNELEELTPRLEFVPGVWLVPQRSRTLPPASHTNAYLVGGRRFVLVDPGSDDPEEVGALVDTIQRRRADGDQLAAIVLTHHHTDHVAGCAMLADLCRVPVLAHRETARRVAPLFDVAVDDSLAEGTVLDLEGLTLICHHTPGHAPGHIALRIPERKLTLIGDLLSGFSTILIPRDGGDMQQYVASLERVRRLNPGQLFPGHGPPLPESALSDAVAHRRRRQQAIEAAVAAGSHDPTEIARAVYGDTVPLPLARAQTEAHLSALGDRSSRTPGESM